MSFKDVFPELAAQWHPSKNGTLLPSDFSEAGGKAEIWWLFPYDDPMTGKHFDFEWKSRISSRITSPGCPFLSNRKIWPGFNDLATKYPELARQWHPTKNGDLLPSKIAPLSEKKIWWIYPYDDPLTGKHFDFEWQAVCRVRVESPGCPFLSGIRVWPGFNDLETLFPEIAKQWHPTKNGNLFSYQFSAYSSQKMWWILPYDDPQTGKHFDFEWQAKISARVSGEGCPFLNGRSVQKGFNDLQTKHPELVPFWNFSKNGDLKPDEITAKSQKKIYWINSRGKEQHCTVQNFLKTYEAVLQTDDKETMQKVQSLQSAYPDLAAQWHPTRNGKLLPTDVLVNSYKKVWWKLAYDDPQTGNHFDFEWQALISDRISSPGCPFLSGRRVWPGFNDLASNYPELARQWHPTRNGDMRPEDVTAHSSKLVWWIFPYDDPITGKHFDFEWESTPGTRTKSPACPYLSGHAVWKGFNDLATLRPELAAQWHPTKNTPLLPEDVPAKTHRKVWWLLSYDDPETGIHFNFEWEAAVSLREKGEGCPYLSGHAVYPGFNDLATKRPDLLIYWDYFRNKELTPNSVTVQSSKKAYWLGENGMVQYSRICSFVYAHKKE